MELKNALDSASRDMLQITFPLENELLEGNFGIPEEETYRRLLKNLDMPEAWALTLLEQVEIPGRTLSLSLSLSLTLTPTLIVFQD